MGFTDRFVTVDGRKVAYVDEGPRDGRPLVCLHGAGFDHAELTWRVTVETLSAHRRVVVPDLPGYGASEAFGDSYDLSDLGRWVTRFLDAMEFDSVDLAGVSMGGGMALWVGINAPERVARLVPVGAYGLMRRVPFHPAARLLARSGAIRVLYAAAHSSRAMARLGLGATYGKPGRVTDRAVDDVMAVAREQAERRSFDNFIVAEMLTTGLKSCLLPEVDSLPMPVMLVHGSHDRVIPMRHSRRAARHIPGAILRILPTGHWPMRERPEIFNPLLDRFLANHPAP